MLAKILDWLLGRKEPELHESDKERRLRVLEQTAQVYTRRHR